MRVRMLTAVIVAMGALCVAGCASAAPTDAGSSVSETPTPVFTAEPGVPQEVAERAKLPACGEIELDQAEPIPEAAVACMDAAGDEGAELIVTAPTVEGEPIVMYYRALPGGGVELYQDSTRDTWAAPGGGWTFASCPDAESPLAMELGECTTTQIGE